MAMKSELNNQDNGHVNLIMHHHIKYRYQDQFYIISYHIFDIMPLIYNISCRTKIHLSFSRLNTGYAAYCMQHTVCIVLKNHVTPCLVCLLEVSFFGIQTFWNWILIFSFIESIGGPIIVIWKKRIFFLLIWCLWFRSCFHFHHEHNNEHNQEQNHNKYFRVY